MKVCFAIAITLAITISNSAIAQVQKQGTPSIKQIREQKMQKIQELQERIREHQSKKKQQGQQSQSQTQEPSSLQSQAQSSSPSQAQSSPSKAQSSLSQAQSSSPSRAQSYSQSQSLPAGVVPLKPSSISLDDRTPSKLSSPAAGAIYAAGTSLRIDPIVRSPRGTKTVLIKYYLQGSGTTRLVASQGWNWCRTGGQGKGVSAGILQLQSYTDGDHDEIKPGSYALIVTVGERTSSFGSERVIASSDQFTIQANPNAAPSRPSLGEPTSYGSNKPYLHTGKLLDRLKREEYE